MLRMIFLLFLLTKATPPWRTFHRLTHKILSYEDEAKFLLISKTFRKFSERILVNDDMTIFKFEDKLKFPFEIALYPKMEQFLQEKISQNSERLKDVEFTIDVHPSGWRQKKVVAMLDRETNELSSYFAGGTRVSFLEIFPVWFFNSGQLPWDLVTSDNIFRMLLKNNFPLGMFSAAALDETLMMWAREFSLPKTALYLTQKRFPKELKNPIDFSQLFYRLISEAKEVHETDERLGRRFLRVFRIILCGLAKLADFQDEFLPGVRTLTYLSRYFPEILEILIKRGLDVVKSGDSLQIAAEYGNVDLIETLLTYGMDVDARGDAGFTALMRAARNMNAESMKVLLSHGADTRNALDILEDAHERNYQYARHENFILCRKLLCCPRFYIEISCKKSFPDKFKLLRDKFVSFCHVAIGV